MAGVLKKLYSTADIRELQKVDSENGFLKFVFAVSMLGLAGMPPFISFWAEFYMSLGLLAASTLIGVSFLMLLILKASVLVLTTFIFAGSSKSKNYVKTPLISIGAALALNILMIILFPFYQQIMEHFIAKT